MPHVLEHKWYYLGLLGLCLVMLITVTGVGIGLTIALVEHMGTHGAGLTGGMASMATMALLDRYIAGWYINWYMRRHMANSG